MDARVDNGTSMLVKMPVTEFVDRVVDGMRANRLELAWFLGAGCSITSGIPGASKLVNEWIERLAKHRKFESESRTDWLKREFGGDRDWNEPSAHYGEVFHRCHPSPHDRQVEIERICMLGDPGIGYATMAQILSHPDVGDKCNTVLTTNFDDLLAEALYFYGSREARPKIISHEALSRFMAGRSRQPTIVKIHGDALFDPRNTRSETRRLAQEFQDRLPHVLQKKAIAFVGYGGRDESIQHFFEHAPEDSLGTTVFWVGKALPPRPMLDWLIKRNAQWVDHGDFDELMCFFRKALALGLPDDGIMDLRWERLGRSWSEFERRFAEKADSEAKAALAPFIDDFRKTLPPGWREGFEAHALAGTDPDAAEVKWCEAMAVSPNDPAILGDYAVFLRNVRKDFDKAEVHYKRALEADPENAINLGNYATFLCDVRSDLDGAEAHFRRSLLRNPEDANTLGNFANFLTDVRSNHDEAEQFYRRALEAKPDNAINLGNYATFLRDVRKDFDGAEDHYKRALEADPQNAITIGAYATFLKNVRGDFEGAEAQYKRALAADEDNAINIGNYALFLTTVRGDHDAAEEHYKRAMALEPENATNLGNYALFLTAIRGRVDEAQSVYKQAIAANPGHANNLGNYALFLNNWRQDADEAEAFYKRAIEADPEHANNFGNYALFLTSVRGDYEGGAKLFERALALDPDRVSFLCNYAALLTDQLGNHDAAEGFYERALTAAPDDPQVLGHFAEFLRTVRKDYVRAGELFGRSLAADTKHPGILTNYATFLAEVPQDFAKAEELYNQALALRPDDANILGNAARLLLAQGRPDGLRRLFEAVTIAWGEGAEPSPLQTELMFYLAAHDPSRFVQALRVMKGLISSGLRSPGWNFEMTIARAQDDRHPEVALLRDLSKVLSQGADPALLNNHVAWRVA